VAEAERVAGRFSEDRLATTPESNVSVLNCTPAASSRSRAAATWATWSAIGMLFGQNAHPNASFCMAASVGLPAWSFACGIWP